MSGAHDTPVDVAVVGSGPAGLSALFHAGFHGLSAALFESHLHLGGQLALLYPELELRGLPCGGRVVARGYMEGLEAQALQFHAPLHLKERVTAIDDAGAGLLSLRTADRFGAGGPPLLARRVILATGAGALLPDPAADEAETPGIHRQLDDPCVLRGRRVVFYAPTVSQAGALIALAEGGKGGGTPASLVVANRRDATSGLSGDELARVGARATILHRVRLVQVTREPGGGLGLRFRREAGTAEDRLELSCDDLVLGNPRLPSLRLHERLGLEAAEGGVRVDGELRTRRPGILACGDVATYPGKVVSLSRTAEEAARAVDAILRDLGREVPA